MGTPSSRNRAVKTCEINKEFAVDQHLGNRFAGCHREAKARHGDVIRPRVAAALSK